MTRRPIIDEISKERNLSDELAGALLGECDRAEALTKYASGLAYERDRRRVMLAVEAGRRTEKVTSLTEGLKGFGKSWNIKLNDDGTVDVWSFSEENGPLIRCTPDGKFILHDVTGYGGCVHEEGSFSTLAEAMMEGETFT